MAEAGRDTGEANKAKRVVSKETWLFNNTFATRESIIIQIYIICALMSLPGVKVSDQAITFPCEQEYFIVCRQTYSLSIQGCSHFCFQFKFLNLRIEFSHFCFNPSPLP